MKGDGEESRVRNFILYALRTTRHPPASPLNSQPSTLNPQPSTLNPQL